MVTDSLQAKTTAAEETASKKTTESVGASEEFAEQTEPEQSVPEQLSKDVVFEILKNQRRRDALRYLKENDGEAKLGDMAEFIAAKENDIEIKALSSSQRKRVYIGLYQCHLPKMDAVGIIDFDKNRGDISLLDTAEQLEQYLDGDVVQASGDAEVAPRAVPSAKRNLTIAGVVAFTVASGLLGAPGLGSIPAAGWAVVSTATLMAITAMETYKHKLHA